MERAYLARDASYHGLFYLGVRTTGIFCRPGCPARTPLPKNVEFFASPKDAMAAGYRPCKRCRPLDPDAQPDWAAKLLAEIEADPDARITGRDLRARGIDPATARRHFLKHYGMTFQAFARSRRLSGALSRIREGAAVDDAVFSSGFGSHSGFREAFSRLFGTSPGRARNATSVALSWIRTPLGPLVAGATDKGICLLEFPDRRMLEAQLRTVGRLFGGRVAPGRNAHLRALEAELARYFDGTLRRFTVPLDAPGTPFQRRVWEQLLAIPPGETRSYEDLAIAIGNPAAVRAVGRANGMNRIAIVIPCHRVIAKDGTLGGYGGGLRRKEFLLALERSTSAPAVSSSSAAARPASRGARPAGR